jgi:hypothetical protein
MTHQMEASMKKYLKHNLTLFIFFCISTASFGQATNLGAAANFTVFTATGDLINSGATTITGNIGTDKAGGTSGFSSSNYTGTAHESNTTTANAAADLLSAYTALNAETCNTTLDATFGNDATITPGVYCLPGSAGVLTGNLTLNGQDTPGAVFIIKIGGALTATAANIILSGSTSWSNVFFVIDGALNVDAASLLRGNILANGAISLANSAFINGRLLSTSGAINLINNTITTDEAPLPVTLASFSAKKSETQAAVLTWTTTKETRSDRFEIQHSLNGKLWKVLGFVDTKGESNILSSYNYTHLTPENGTNLYRLKMVDRDGTLAYSKIEGLGFSIEQKLVFYPNPVADLLTLNVNDISHIQRIQIYSITGTNVVYDKTRTSEDLPSKLDVKNFPSGLYIVRITQNSGNVIFSRLIKQ